MNNENSFDNLSGKYTHIKTGNLYFVEGVVVNATNSQDGQLMVLYGPSGSNKLFVREISEFFQKLPKIYINIWITKTKIL
ncbi:MAG: hypothetical protein K9H48_07725 [Melioribacteraceae bacterium]|nr:hypothetical protein [Melioribacteraceae bacterium]